MKANPFMNILPGVRYIPTRIWHDEGVMPLISQIVSDQIPRFGESDNPIIEANRLLTGLYHDNYNNGGGNEVRWAIGKEFRAAISKSDFEPDVKKLIKSNFSTMKKMTGKYGARPTFSGVLFEKALEEVMSNLRYQSALILDPAAVSKIEADYSKATDKGLVIQSGSTKLHLKLGNNVSDTEIKLPLRSIQGNGIKAYAKIFEIQDVCTQALNLMAQKNNEHLNSVDYFYQEHASCKRINKSIQDTSRGNFFENGQLKSGDHNIDINYVAYNEDGVNNDISASIINRSGSEIPTHKDIDLKFNISGDVASKGITTISELLTVYTMTRQIESGYHAIEKTRELHKELVKDNGSNLSL